MFVYVEKLIVEVYFGGGDNFYFVVLFGGVFEVLVS